MEKKLIKIFILEDEPLTLKGIESFIEEDIHDKKFKVCKSQIDSNKLIENIRASSPDLVIVDLRIKNEIRLDLIEEINTNFSTIPVLVLSMLDDFEYAYKTFQAGASGYVGKDDDPENLLKAIDRIMDGFIYFKKDAIKSGLDSDKMKINQVSELTQIQMKVYSCLGNGLGVNEIADKLSLNEKTIYFHCNNIIKKLKLRNINDLKRDAMKVHMGEITNQHGLQSKELSPKTMKDANNSIKTV